MTPVRLVASDLDGTLLGSDGIVSARTAAALAAAHESGLDVVFVTGRPLRWAAQVFDHVGGHGLVICANGALVWDVEADRPRLQRALQPDDALTVAESVRAAYPDAVFAAERLTGFALEPAYSPRWLPGADVQRLELPDLLAEPVLKLLVRHEALVADDYAAHVAELAGARATVTFSDVDSLLEVSAPGVTKASTLALLCEERGIDAGEVVALGDMPNDVAMLRWAGTSYAMASAHPLAIEAATHRAASNDDDGVARVIEQIVAQGVSGARADRRTP